MSVLLTSPLPSTSEAFSFEVLRRFPDLEADNLVAVDATDRLVLAEASAAIEATAGPEAGQPGEGGRVVVVGDRYGAMTLGAMALHGARQVRVHQDPLTAEQALRRNAARTGLSEGFSQLPLTAELFTGATVVVGQLPKSLDALREISQLAAAHCAPGVAVFLGGRVKHMTHAMNDVLSDSFTDVRASLAHQKSRVLVARGPRPGTASGQGARAGRTEYPLRVHHVTLTCGFAPTALPLPAPRSTSGRDSCWSSSTACDRPPARQWTSAVAPASSPRRWPGRVRR